MTTYAPAATYATEEIDFLENAKVGDTRTHDGDRIRKTSTVLSVVEPDVAGGRTLICETITTFHSDYGYWSRVTPQEWISLGPDIAGEGLFVTRDPDEALSSSEPLGGVTAAQFSAKGLAAAHAKAVDRLMSDRAAMQVMKTQVVEAVRALLD